MHQIESRWQRIIIGVLGIIASIFLLVASGTMNARYGAAMGRFDSDKMIYGGAAAASDVLMAAAPFFFFAAVRNRAVTQMLASFIVWLVTTAFAFQSAIGHAALNRMDTTSVREVAATSYADVRSELEQARKSRGFVPAVNGTEISIRAEIEKHKVNRMWTASNECTESSGKAQREYCSQYQQLQADLGNAMQATKLDERIAMLTARSDKLSGSSTSVKSEADPQAVVIERFLRMVHVDADVRTVQSGLAFILAMVVLVGAGLGPYASLSLLASSRRIITVRAMPPPLHVGPDGKPPAVAEIGQLPDVPAAPVKGKLPAPSAPGIPGHVLARLMRPPHKAAIPRLIEIDYPMSKPKGERRLAHTKRAGFVKAAENYALWLQAYELAGVYEPAQIEALYLEFCRHDHRVPCHTNMLMGALADLPKKHGIQRRDVNKLRKWIISAPRWDQPQKPPEKPQEGRDSAPVSTTVQSEDPALRRAGEASASILGGAQFFRRST